MKKFLRAQDVKVEFIVSGDAYDKSTFEQMILASKRASGWGGATDADLVITHCDTDDGTFVAFKTLTVAPLAAGTVLNEVNLVALKQYFKIAIESSLVDVVAVFADNRLVITPDAELDLIVNPTPRDTLDLDSFNI